MNVQHLDQLAAALDNLHCHGALRVRQHRNKIRESELSHDELAVLRMIVDGTKTVKALIAQLNLGKPQASRVVNSLESHDPPLARRSINRTDKRSFDVTITDEGRKLIDEFTVQRRERILQLLQTMASSTQDVETTVQVLLDALGALSAHTRPTDNEA